MSPVVLLTRPERRSRGFGDRLLRVRPGPIEILVSPLIEIRCMDANIAVPDAGELIFTSQSALECLPRGLAAKGRLAWCVGERTAEAARVAGFDAVSAGGDAEALVALLLRARPAAPLLHLRGRHARGDVAARLTAAGLPTRDRVVYRQEDRPLDQLAVDLLTSGAEVVAPVFSPRSSQRLAAAAPGAGAHLHVVAISDAAAVPWSGRGVRVSLAAEPSGEAMVQATLQALDAR